MIEEPIISSIVTTNPDFEVKDGYLNFKSLESYLKIRENLEGKTEKELKEWSSQYSYKSLQSAYEQEDFIIQQTGDTILYEKQKNRVMNGAFKTLLNHDGIIMIEDTITKIKGEYLYRIPSKDKQFLNMIQNTTEELKDIPLGILKTKHTVRISQNTKAKKLQKIMTRTDVFNLSGTNIRVFTEFHVFIGTDGIGAFLDFSMRGKGQKNVMWWWPPYDDNFEWAEFTIHSGGTYNVGGGPISLPGTTTPRGVLVPTVSCNYFVGGYQFISSVQLSNVSITYHFCKNFEQGEMWVTESWGNIPK